MSKNSRGEHSSHNQTTCDRCGGTYGHSKAACRQARYRRSKDPLIGTAERRENQLRGLEKLREAEELAEIREDLHATGIMSMDAGAEDNDSNSSAGTVAKSETQIAIEEDLLLSEKGYVLSAPYPRSNRHGYIGEGPLWKQLLREATIGEPSRHALRHKCAASSPRLKSLRLYKQRWKPGQPAWSLDPMWRAWQQAAHAVKHLEGAVKDAENPNDPVVPIAEEARFTAWKNRQPETVTRQKSGRAKVVHHLQDLSSHEREILRVSLSHHIADASELRDRLSDDSAKREENVIKLADWKQREAK